jgi:hypothetical protein
MSVSRLLIKRSGVRTPLEFRALTRMRERLVGLLGSGPDARPVALVRCSSVHTWGMRYRIDVAFLSREGEVLRVVRALPPGRVLSCHGSWLVLERPHGRGAWLRQGECVRIDGEASFPCSVRSTQGVSPP